MELEVVTYGGIAALERVFNGVAMLFNGQGGGIVRPLSVVMASIGALYAVIKALFSQSPSSFLSQYLMPMLLVGAVLMVPSSDVRIMDVVKNEQRVVSHVPMLLARFAELVSSMGFQLTGSLEAVMHVPDDMSYARSGLIFGADAALDMHFYEVNDPVLEKNLRHFSKQCLLYDVALGQYGIEELKKTCDLWKLLKQRTSKVRMIPYDNGEGDTQYLSCRDAMEKMDHSFNRQEQYYLAQGLTKYLDLSFQALTKIATSRGELIRQQLMMNLLRDEYSGQGFAAERAHEQQKSTYIVMGQLASRSLVTMRVVIEALIYASFALVIPLSLLPGGLKIIGNWVWLVAWIQIWPAFYCILNYVMMIHAQSEAGAVFQGCAGNEHGLSFFTSTGIRRLHEDIYALSGYLSASIPFLSYSILQGGIGSFIHMAGAMMTPAHNSAGAIAGEMSSGNLSYANTTMGSLSYGNQSMLQENSAPSIRTGFTELHQENGAMRAGQENVLLWENSRLPTEMSIEKSVAGSSNRATQQMMSEVQTRQDSLSRTFQATSREVGDSIQHEAITDSYTVGESLREGADSRAAANRMFQLGADWCRAQDLSENEVGEVVGGAVASLGTSLGLAASASGSVGANLKGALSRSETARAAMQLAENTQFQEAYDLYQGAANSSGLNHSEDDGTRRSDSISASLDTLNSELESYQSSVTKLDQLSATKSFLKNESVNQRHMLSQRFMDFLSEREGGMLEAQRLLTGKGESRRLESLITEFSDIHAQGIDPVLWGKADTGKYSVTWEAGKSIQEVHQDNLSQVDEMSLSRGFGKSDPDSLRSEFKMNLNEQLGKAHGSHAQISTEGQARGDFFREEQKGDLRGNRLAFLRKAIAGQGVEHLQEQMKTTSPQLPFVYRNQ